MSGVNNDEDKKPGTGDQGAHINLKVKGQVRFYLFIYLLNHRFFHLSIY